MVGDRARTTMSAITASSPPPAATCRPSVAGSAPSARDDLLARGGQRALGDVVADQVDRRHERLGLHRQQAGGAGEVVRVGLGVDLDVAVVEHLGVEHVGAAAEVDDVEHVDVLAQLLLGDLELVDDVVDAQALAAAAGGDEHAGQRDQAGEALGADGAALALAVGRVGDLGDAVGGRAAGACARARGRRCAGRRSGRRGRAPRARARAGRAAARGRRARAPRRRAGARRRTWWRTRSTRRPRPA